MAFVGGVGYADRNGAKRNCVTPSYALFLPVVTSETFTMAIWHFVLIYEDILHEHAGEKKGVKKCSF